MQDAADVIDCSEMPNMSMQSSDDTTTKWNPSERPKSVGRDVSATDLTSDRQSGGKGGKRARATKHQKKGQDRSRAF